MYNIILIIYTFFKVSIIVFKGLQQKLLFDKSLFNRLKFGMSLCPCMYQALSYIFFDDMGMNTGLSRFRILKIIMELEK